jgi:hypothetical protein
MKFTVSLLSLVLISACNPDDYFDVNTLIEGADAVCSQAKDLATCQMLPMCQPAYEDVETELEEPIFAACIANPPAPDDGTTTTDDGSSTDDGSNPTDDDGTISDDGSTDEVPPTIDDVIANGCDKLDPQYLYVKKITEKKSSGGSKKTSVKRQVKVKICHQTGNLDSHTIIIACPAVKSHKEHHDDYVGACEPLVQ